MALPTESQNPSNESALPQSETRPPVGFATKAFASGLFSGFFPIASGTAGSAVALAIYWIPGAENPYILAPLTLVVLLLGIKASTIMERTYGHDPSEVTIDEVVGMWISVLFLPKRILVSFLAFIVFRILDIVKPYPARRFDSLQGGAGIMLDDVVSAIYTNLFMQLVVALNIV